MNREQAHEIFTEIYEGENYITHSYAVEAIMRGLAKRLAPDQVEFWKTMMMVGKKERDRRPSA